MKKRQSDILAEHLQLWSKPDVIDWATRFRSTPYLSAQLGIRNAPDAVMKLRKRGHVIRTEMVSVEVAGRMYRNIASYVYIRGPEKRPYSK